MNDKRIAINAAAAIFVFSIVAIHNTVKTHAADLPNVSQTSPADTLKDSIKDTAKKDLAQVIEYMMQNGADGKVDKNLAPEIGLSGPMPMKAANIRTKKDGDNREALNCTVFYEVTPGDSGADDKKPTCMYLMKVTEGKSVKDHQWFRVNLDGKLEKVVTSRVQKDESGAVVRGSGVTIQDDMDSPTVQKTFAAEMREVKIWLKAQKKLAAKKASPAKAKR